MPKMNDAPDSAITTGPALWPDVETLFGVRGDPARCWCRFFAMTNPEYKNTTPAERKSHLHARFDSSEPEPGVMAYLDGEPVGWCAVEPRSCYPRIESSQLMRAAAPGLTELPDPGTIWSITCFVVAPGQRRKGIAAALLQAAVEHAFTHGAGSVEGYPVDPAARPKASAADLYHGTLSLFQTAGFRLVDTTTPGRAVVRLDKVSG
ncbi:GNAT family N-acetyltransferase [Arthrobacter rhizosphaerae]|uniref:GNAT family N-acetyltransferase n=1 Tax=Arthrobacter rhizosphaerae TaxID=2855490 RepID=UPI001FF6E303|nr:GNAT family N-acetyltransferase [Arthrobacter rhizosphaerae]